MNVMVVGLLAVAAYFVVVAIWMKRQGRRTAAPREGTTPEQGRGRS